MFSKSELKENLAKCVANVKFNKADGSVREMLCTLMSDYLPTVEPLDESQKVPRKDNDDVLAVWDMDKKAWRSFRLDSIINIDYIGVNRV